MTFQRTLKSPIPCSGIGLHSGAKVSMVMRPAEPDSGVRFVRTDVRGRDRVVPAAWDAVSDTRLCTVVANADGVSVGTVEHLMAALHGCGVDNAVIEIDGPEVPIMDGSSEPFAFLVDCAGTVEQTAPRRFLRVLKPVTVGDETRSAMLAPGDVPSFGFEIDFPSAAVARQSGRIQLANGSFRTEISRARTFGFLHEVDQMRRMGLARGGSLDNAIVIDGDRVMNEGGLRFEDEFVRHKILDSVGDLYLAGGPILGRYHGVRAGHALNNAVLRALFADPSAFCWSDAAGIPLGTEGWRTDERVAVNA